MKHYVYPFSGSSKESNINGINGNNKGSYLISGVNTGNIGFLQLGQTNNVDPSLSKVKQLQSHIEESNVRSKLNNKGTKSNIKYTCTGTTYSNNPSNEEEDYFAELFMSDYNTTSIKLLSDRIIKTNKNNQYGQFEKYGEYDQFGIDNKYTENINSVRSNLNTIETNRTVNLNSNVNTKSNNYVNNYRNEKHVTFSNRNSTRVYSNRSSYNSNSSNINNGLSSSAGFSNNMGGMNTGIESRFSSTPKSLNISQINNNNYNNGNNLRDLNVNLNSAIASTNLNNLNNLNSLNSLNSNNTRNNPFSKTNSYNNNYNLDYYDIFEARKMAKADKQDVKYTQYDLNNSKEKELYVENVKNELWEYNKKKQETRKYLDNGLASFNEIDSKLQEISHRGKEKN